MRCAGTAAAAFALGCSADAGSDTSSLDDMSALSRIGKHVVEALAGDPDLAAWRGRTWELTTGNELQDGWLVPTPSTSWWGDALADLPVGTKCTTIGPTCDPDFQMYRCNSDSDCPSGSCKPIDATMMFPGETPEKLCAGHSDRMEEEVYHAVASAKSFVDITGLWQPQGRFIPALRDAFERIAASGHHVTVRILSANSITDGPFAYSHTSALLSALTDGLAADAPLTFYVAKHTLLGPSWNHAKMVAVDGKFALVGGHNLTTEDYQLKDPVFDLSMRLTGPAAIAAERFADELWSAACAYGTTFAGLATWPADIATCPQAFAREQTTKKGGVPVISVGRLGETSHNASDAALLAMVEAAKHTVVMSQQDLLAGKIIGPVAIAGPPGPLLDRLAAAIARGVDVYLVMSNTDGGFFGASYSNDWTAADTAKTIGSYMAKKKELFPDGTDIIGVLCDRLHVASILASSATTWPDGEVLHNHAKFLMVDKQTFYVGSQNLYPADLAEFGFILDSSNAASEANDTYWTPLWTFSKRIAVSGSDAPTCVLRD